MKAFKIDFSFILIAICFLFSPYQMEFLKLILVLCIHEFGHFFFALVFKIKIKSVRLYAMGFLMDIDHRSLAFIKEFFVYFGGILFNLLFLWILPADFRKYTVFLLVLNALPIYPLDGFRIMHTLCSYLFPYRISSYIMHILSGLCLGILTFFFIRRMDYLLLVNLLYLWWIEWKLLKNLSYNYQAFILHRHLYPTNFKSRKIKFRHNAEQYLYKYHNIYMMVGEKRISQSEILKLKYDGL